MSKLLNNYAQTKFASEYIKKLYTRNIKEQVNRC